MLPVRRLARPLYREIIGNREVVGPSFTGREDYYDLAEQPCPSIRFKEPNEESIALREKEKSSWKGLTLEEKKKLYRHSFCQTLVENEAPNCEGRRIFGNVLFMMSIPIVLYAILQNTLMPPMPQTMSDQGKKQMVRYWIDVGAEPLDGVASKWDYEKNQWKEKPFYFMKNK